jgi:hypothetical protein
MATTSRLSPLTMATAYYDLLDQLLLTMATTYYDLIKEVGLREDGEHAHAAAPQLVQYLTVRGAPDQGERWGQAQAQRDIEGGGEGGGRGGVEAEAEAKAEAEGEGEGEAKGDVKVTTEGDGGR